MATQKSSAKQQPAHRLLLRIGVSLVVLAAAVYVLATHWNMVNSSLQVARHASIAWLALSLLLMAGTFLIAAGIYSALTLHKLRYWQTVLVEVSTAFVNRLLPSGLGGLGLHGVYLYKRKHTAAEATAVVSVNNLLGMVAHLTLLTGVLLFGAGSWQDFTGGWHLPLHWWYVLVVIGATAGIWALPTVRRHLQAFWRNLLDSLHKISLVHLARAFCLALLLTVTYTFILFSTARSLGLHLGLVQVFIIFSVGMLTSTATPTPGGLVGAEAGLFAGFVAYNVPSATAGAAVLLYRLVTYWLPLIPGVLALLLARRRRLV